MKSNTDYLIKKLRKFNLPMPRNIINDLELKEIEKQLSEIEDSIRIFRNHLNNATKQYRN